MSSSCLIPSLYLANYAKRYVGTTETSPNRGPEIDLFKLATAGKVDALPWCATFIWYCIKKTEMECGVKSPLVMGPHVMSIWEKSPVQCRVKKPIIGDLVVWNFLGTTSGHMGVIAGFPKAAGKIITIEGNTSPSSSVDREGDGVYEKVRSMAGSASMPVVGYLRPF